ncbi:MAG: hypothetical protein K1000chlam2_00635 [Chlamydiae bacterium]|nr:hypothetical protein [Chlamydiota bacterium]
MKWHSTLNWDFSFSYRTFLIAVIFFLVLFIVNAAQKPLTLHSNRVKPLSIDVKIGFINQIM